VAGVKRIAFDLVLGILASPVYAALALRRTLRNFRFLRIASAALIVCECGERLSLVGMWSCSCGHYVYRGHLLTACPVCGALPCVIRCYRCGITTKLPEPE
jgi:hypothetical protein